MKQPINSRVWKVSKGHAYSGLLAPLCATQRTSAAKLVAAAYKKPSAISRWRRRLSLCPQYERQINSLNHPVIVATYRRITTNTRDTATALAA